MQIGDIVKVKPDFQKYATVGDALGVVIKTDKSLEVTSHCVKVAWPHRTGMPRISMLELVSESR
jgi:hypothetical protein